MSHLVALSHSPLVVIVAYVIGAAVLAVALARGLHVQHCEVCQRTGYPTVKRNLGNLEFPDVRHVCAECAWTIENVREDLILTDIARAQAERRTAIAVRQAPRGAEPAGQVAP